MSTANPSRDGPSRDGAPSPPEFDGAFRDRLEALFRWRRDVRRFRTDPVDEATVEELVSLAALSPSVGFSQPWRFVLVEDPGRRAAIRENFLRCNRDALAALSGERAKRYAGLKLAGIDEAPVQLAVFADTATEAGHGLGRGTMPGMLHYSAVLAVHTFWLAARARGIGVGWVSILDPLRVATTLDVPATWDLVAYLCVGLPAEWHPEPELLRQAWQERDLAASLIDRR